jgi:hypothetical protein
MVLWVCARVCEFAVRNKAEQFHRAAEPQTLTPAAAAQGSDDPVTCPPQFLRQLPIQYLPNANGPITMFILPTATHRVNVADVSQYRIESPLEAVVVAAPPSLLPPIFLPPVASVSVVSVSPPTVMLHRPCFELVWGKDVAIIAVPLRMSCQDEGGDACSGKANGRPIRGQRQAGRQRWFWGCHCQLVKF